MDNEITKEIIDWSLDESLSKQIMEYFKTKIKSGCFPPGTVLPSLQYLSGKLEIDINYVRDAMDLLREEHLVKTTNGVGTTVLKENEWKCMAILLPDIACWHWQRIYKEIAYFMDYNKWEVKLFPHEGRLELISKYLSEISNGDYFGAIMAIPMALLKKDDALFSRMRASGFPMVFIGGGINCWSVDDMLYACGYTGTKHLIEQGYKKIGIIGSRAYNGEEFVEGCKKALEDAEMTDTATGYADDEAFALKMLDLWMSVDNKPDALFYQRSDYGDKCFQWLQSKRIQIGPEMGFIAIDDTAFHKYTIPSPTAVRMFPHKIGKQAVDLFLELVTLPKKERLVAKRVNADFNLNQGRSSQKGPRGRQIYHAMNPMPGVQDMGNSYYPPEPPMPPGYWDGFNQY